MPSPLRTVHCISFVKCMRMDGSCAVTQSSTVRRRNSREQEVGRSIEYSHRDRQERFRRARLSGIKSDGGVNAPELGLGG